jgi:hypothetical protein
VCGGVVARWLNVGQRDAHAADVTNTGYTDVGLTARAAAAAAAGDCYRSSALIERRERGPAAGRGNVRGIELGDACAPRNAEWYLHKVLHKNIEGRARRTVQSSGRSRVAL